MEQKDSIEEFELDSNQAFDLGYAMAAYELPQEASNAYAKGEIELWLEFNRPKTMEEWEDFHEKHGTSEELHARWGNVVRQP